MDIREILTCHCDACGDTFEVTTEVRGVDKRYTTSCSYEGAIEDFNKSCNWWSTPKECWNCHKKYVPFKLGRRMDDFVMAALKRCKM
jgi:hypothetical protein